ncbi:MAG: guanylate kinase [Nitrospirae bacterium]|jgi:guanylate kinase|nr:guanylate kinase [Nitrospirota bacterium]
MRDGKPLQAKKAKGNLFIISAPSGAGKTTLCKKLVCTLPDLKFSVSYTTRQPRPGEINNRDYTFISREAFASMIEKEEFIEWAEVHEELYGTSRKRVEELMESGSDVILDIDTQGAMQIKNKFKKGTYVFILPPSLDILRKRLENRLTDPEEEIEKRIKRAISEIKTYTEYGYVIINDILEEAFKELASIVISQRTITELINPLWIEDEFLKRR